MQTEHQKRIEDRSIPVPECGCWLWTGQIGKNGYGRDPIGARQNYMEAHRSSYVAFKGRIAKGLLVRHKCDTPSCVNPDHLLTGTHRDNMLDMWQRNRHPKSKNYRKGGV
ncbi:HNH endonuclease signature motif containing protein [Xanthomonas sacchari]